MKPKNGFKNILGLVGVHLAELRLKKGFTTIREFAQKYDLPEIQYWRMERGRANITLKSLVKILNIHNLTVKEFFCLMVDQKMAA
jgi:transcriptional regulator with XRE-family HTH domain